MYEVITEIKNAAGTNICKRGQFGLRTTRKKLPHLGYQQCRLYQVILTASADYFICGLT